MYVSVLHKCVSNWKRKESKGDNVCVISLSWWGKGMRDFA